MSENDRLAEPFEESRAHLRAVAYRMLGSMTEADDAVQEAWNWARGAVAFAQGARFARPALVDGAIGVVLAPRGRLFRVLRLTIERGKIVGIDVVGDPARLRQLELSVVSD